jgi:tetratricopeptide (TPR) repeat protein
MNLAELYTRQGLVAEARNQYLSLADHFDKEGQVKEALEVFQKLADLDPSNLSVRVKLGSNFQKENMHEKAALEWAKAAEGYLKEGQAEEAHKLLSQAMEIHPEGERARMVLAAEKVKKEDYQEVIKLLEPVMEAGTETLESLKVYSAALLKIKSYPEAVEALKKARELDPGSQAVRENLGLALLKAGQPEEARDDLMKLIGTYLKENRWDRAEKLAVELQESDPDDPRILQNLVEVYDHTDNKPSLIETYGKLAELYQKKDLKKNVLGVYQKLLEVEPDNEEWSTRMEKLRQELGVEKPEPSGSPGAPAVEAEKGEEPIEKDLETVAAMGEGAVSEVDREILVSETAMSTVENYLKQGLFREAEVELLRMHKEEPALETLKMLKEVYRLQDKVGDYVNLCFQRAALLEKENRRDDALAEYQDILSLEPGNQKAKERMADQAVHLDDGVAPDEEQQPVAEAVGDPITDEEAAPTLEIPEAEVAQFQDLDLGELAGELSLELEEQPPQAGPGMEGEAPTLEMSDEEATVVLIPEDIKESIDEMLAEADFYYQQGLFKDAVDLYRQIESLAPGLEEVQEKLAELADKTAAEKDEKSPAVAEEDRPVVQEGVEAGMPEVSTEARFEVAPEPSGDDIPTRVTDMEEFISGLKMEMEEPPSGQTDALLEDEGLLEIFKEFQEGVKEHLPEEDYETHYNLGIAYKEMGLMDEAVAEFEHAARSKKFALDAVSMMALCYKDLGQLEKAAAALEHALADISLSPEVKKGLLWELAGVYEQLGDLRRAIDGYRSVADLDPAYQGVEAKIRELESSREEAPPETKKTEDPKEDGEEEPPGGQSSKVSYL